MTDAVTHYAMGVLFDKGATRVALLRKGWPEGQKGRLNAPGGHVEAGETYRQACSREVHEETGALVHPSDWQPVLGMSGRGWVCYVFTARYHGDFSDVCTQSAEEPIVKKDIHHGLFITETPCTNALRWIVAAAWDAVLDRGEGSSDRGPKAFAVCYDDQDPDVQKLWESALHVPIPK